MMILLLFLPSFGLFDNEKQKYTAYSEAGDPATMTLVNATKNNYPTNPTGNFSLAAVGDFGCTPNTINTVRNIQSVNPDLIIALGDYSYEPLAGCWLATVDPIDEKMKIVIGNHDNETAEGLKQYMSHFKLEKQYYSFHYQNTHFVQMSTEVPFGNGSQQYNFVKDDLQKAASDPSISWIIVSVHKLLYTSPSKIQAIPGLRDTYHELFDRYGVDLVLQGHQHNYQRTYPINYNNESNNTKNNKENPIVRDSNSSVYINPKGPIFVTVGTGGISLFPFDLTMSNYVAKRYSGYGFLHIDFSNDTLKAMFHTNEDMSIKDQSAIIKSDNRDYIKNLVTNSGPS